MENIKFISSCNSGKLFSIFFSPQGDINKTGIVFCQPFAQERSRSKRFYVNLARFMALRGYPSILFDYWGEGNSEGNFEDATIATRVSDCLVATNLLKNEFGLDKVIPLGVRFGGAIALLATLEHIISGQVILIEPVLDGELFFNEWLRVSIAAQMAMYKKVKTDRLNLVQKVLSNELIENEGYRISKKFYESLAKIKLFDSLGSSERDLLVITLTNENSVFDRKLNERIKASMLVNPKLFYLNVSGTFFWNTLRRYDPSPEYLYSEIFNWMKRYS